MQIHDHAVLQGPEMGLNEATSSVGRNLNSCFGSFPHQKGGLGSALHKSAPMWKHWVARACTPYEPFLDFEVSRRSWNLLKKQFPEMIAAVLMPNHLHFIVPEGEICHLVGFLGAVSKWLRVRRLWQPIPQPAEIPDRHHLRRQVRYIALNPCRKKLCQDPLEWYWSTYRESMGAALEGRPILNNLTTALGESSHKFAVRFHSYVSSDPSVCVEGTPLPTPAIPRIWARQSISEILAAASAALRIPPDEVKNKGELRPLFIHLAYRHGWRQVSLLANICGIEPRSVRRILSHSPPAGMDIGDLCLGDPRLRKFSDPEWD